MSIHRLRNFAWALALVVLTIGFSSVAFGQQPPAPAASGGGMASHASMPTMNDNWPLEKLNKSPRHREWVSVKYGSRTVKVFVVYPEVKEKAPVVLVIHEIFGLSNWARSMADDLAAAGYIAVAPDLLSGFGPNGGGSDSFPDQDATVKAVSNLNADTVTADLNAVADYGKKLPAANGKLAVVGFCWGGGNSFRFATNRKDLSAAFVFYGPGPDPAAIKSIQAPVYGFYAGNDSRIGATIPATTEEMKAAGKKYEPVTYDGAGHGFMRAGEAPDAKEADQKARIEGFERLTTLLKSM
jgi:carboxymethylenebutenolidase